MDTASVYYLGVTVILFVVFAIIVARVYSGKRKAKGEEPKYRMMEDEKPHETNGKGGRNVRRK